MAPGADQSSVRRARTPLALSVRDARKLALVCQRLPRSDFARGRAGVLQAIEHLGYVQIDTISVVQRAHHHTLWCRVPHYRTSFLDRLIAERRIYEYWWHAAAYLPMSSFRFSLPRMQAIASGQRHWYRANRRVMNEILARVRAEGPLQAADFDDHQGTSGMWDWGPVKQAIERLFMEGRLLVTRRQGFTKLFDLAERVVPDHIDRTLPDEREYAEHLIDSSLRAHGFVLPTEVSYLRKGMGNAVRNVLEERLADGTLRELRIKRLPGRYYTTARLLDQLDRRLSGKARILSPFDNLVIQRKRVNSLFDFDYQIECYLPASKRQHGYFCLPILWRGALIARLDAKAWRDSRCLELRNLVIEQADPPRDAFVVDLARELAAFAAFNDCDEVDAGALERRLAEPLREALAGHSP